MDKAVPDPPRPRSERKLRGAQAWMVSLYSFLTVLFVAQLVWRAQSEGRDGSWFVMLTGTAFLAAAVVGLALRTLALSSWRGLPVGPGERLLWGTFADRVLPTGGAAYPGRFALSTTRLRYLPDPISRLRGVTGEEWPATALHDVRVTPVDERRRRRGGRWVMVDVDGGASITLMSNEAHLVADELFEALRVASPATRD
ncbi:hypothetical protein [Frigoribacterium sp. MCBA15_019]|uniref:hypothetical protein n=2 Tax=unclassified Frigoribacterium TaxID=2627005 RepID=UPI0008DE407E|nr:hypothetical protein [Frigoribacterium sp. MCBA15_019]OII21908.1 hypothetical protein BIV04_09960 [Frigoribacterium sp. MCBA15_019]